MSAPSYASEPQVQYLHQILEQMERAELLIPDFQRPPRWTDEQRRRLLESVSGGYPIGSLMVWRTTVQIPHRTRIGPHAISAKVGTIHQYQYLLDGFQRMSTLFAALGNVVKPLPREPDHDGHRWLLGYHLLNEEWVFLNEVDEQDSQVVLPGYLLLDSIRLIRAQRKLMDHPEVETLLERSDALVRSLREYKLAVIPMVTDEVNEAVRTFGLLNTEGTKMSDLDLLVAISWTKDHDLRARLDDAKKILGRVGWEELDEKYIMAALRGAFDLALYDKKADAKKLGERLRAEPEVLEAAITGLANAGTFLSERCGVVALELLPYSYQAVLLGDVLRRHPTRSSELDTALMQWFWWTTAWGTFAGVSGYRMNGMIAYLRGVGEGKDMQWPWRVTDVEPTPLPRTTDPRAARTRAIALHLFRNTGQPPELRRRLEAHAAGAFVRGLSDLPASLARDPGNAFLVSFELEVSLLETLDQRRHGSSVDLNPAAILHWLQISSPAWDALGRGDAKAFIEDRRGVLESIERSFLQGLGLPPGVA
jgi:Protein of unknown function DUF262